MVQQLGLHAITAEGLRQGTKSPQDSWYSKNKQNLLKPLSE